jgi:arylformamidase
MSGREPGGWIDLTEPLAAGALVYPEVLPGTTLVPITGENDGRPHVSLLTTTTHSGTHMDAPRHFFADGLTIDQIPLARLHGTACVKHLDVRELSAIGPTELERAAPALRRGEMLFLSTGWEHRRGTSAYVRHPYMTPEAADWVVERGATLLGVDVITPEAPLDHRPSDYRMDVHTTILGAGIPIIEQLRLGELAGRRAEVMAFPLALVGGDGAPVRVVARVLQDE